MNGLGTSIDPYIIETPEDLNAIRNKLSSHYKLGNDIDMSDWGNFPPIGSSLTSGRFTGSLDGDGYCISNLNIHTVNMHYVGLFSYVSGATISNVGLVDANVHGTYNYIGTLVGAFMSSTIDNCFSTGNITGNGNYVGGLVGWLNGTVINSYSSVNVDGREGTGGLVAITNSATSIIQNCYSNGLVKKHGTYYGGLVARVVSGSSIDSYWDIETSGLNTSFSSEVGKTTAEMKQQSTFTNWDFDTIWQMGAEGYPTLQVFGVTSSPVQKVTVDITAFTESIQSFTALRKRKTITSLTYTSEVSSSVSRELVTSAVAMVEALSSSIEVKLNANVKNYTVTASVAEITASVQAKRSPVQAIRNVSSHIEPITFYVTVIVPVDVEKPIFATVHYVVNPTTVSGSHSKTIVHSMKNSSVVHAINGKTNVTHKENRTETRYV